MANQNLEDRLRGLLVRWVDLGSSIYAKMHAAALYGKVTADGDTAVTLDSSGRVLVTPRSGAVALTDGISNTVDMPEDADGDIIYDVNIPLRYNGSTWDRPRNNVAATALASAVRSTDGVTTDITNHNAKGILVFVDVTVASGTGGLTTYIEGKDPVSNAYRGLNSAPSALTTTGNRHYMMYPGLAALNNGATQIINAVLPRTFRIKVVAGDASNYTYSVGYCLIN